MRDPNNKGVLREVPATEWIHTIIHENGSVQTWTVTSFNLQKQILETLQKGFSTIEFWKAKTGQQRKDVEYHVVGVR